ncbi:putative sulfate permease C3H7.02, partial [Varanus komodoensis]
MEGASESAGKNCDGAMSSNVADQLIHICMYSADSEDVGKGPSSPDADISSKDPESRMANPESVSTRGMELEETTEEPAIAVSEQNCDRSSCKESQEGKVDGSAEPGSDIITSEGLTELSSHTTMETSLSSA